MSLPDVSEAFSEWTDTITFRVVQKQVVDGILTEGKVADWSFEGVLEPMPKRELKLKPEGQWSWEWFVLWTTQKLDTDSIVVDGDGNKFRVKSSANWNRAGYYEYDVTATLKDA